MPRTVSQILYGRRHAKRFRSAGLRSGPGLPEVPWEVRREQAIERLRELLVSECAVSGAMCQVIKKGQHTWMVYPRGFEAVVAQRVRVWAAGQVLELCHTTTGARCFGRGRARVKVSGIVMELCEEGNAAVPGQKQLQVAG